MFPPISTLLPQKESSLLLDAVLEHSAERTVCSAKVSAAHPYLVDRRVQGALSLELLAQAAAARAALESSALEGSALEGAEGGQPRKGYVVAVPWLDLDGGPFALGDEMIVSVEPTHLGGSLVKYKGEVSVAGQVRARGELSVLLAKEPS